MSKYQKRKVAHKMKRDLALGTICCNCGKECGDEIEYHHIVPLEWGGRDVETNVAALCADCHSMCTHGFVHKKAEKSGRPRKVYDETLADIVFTKYINKQLSEIQARKVLGTGQHIKEMKIFHEWCEKNNINTRMNYGQSGRWYK